MKSIADSAVIYCRISKDAEGDELGVKRQLADCTALADRLDLTVVDTYIDNDTGASDRTNKKAIRHEYLRMLADGREGKYAHLIAHSASRLTRRPRELEQLVEFNKETSIALRMYDTGSVDLSTANGLMTARIMAAVDAAESDRISERQKNTFRHNALAGLVKLSHQRAFGWNDDGKTLRPSEAALVREGLSAILQGSSLTAIARDWEKRGVRTAADRERWDTGTLKRVLTGWRAAGIRTYKITDADGRVTRDPILDARGQMVRGEWEPIITLEERAAAVAMLNQRIRKKVRQGSWLLSGLVFCELCGGRMYGALKRGEYPNTYQCKPGRSHVAIHAAKLEGVVYDQLVFRLFDKRQKAIEAGADESPKMPDVWPGEDRLAEVHKLIEELMEAYRSRTLAGAVVFPQVDLLHAERSELQRAREQFEAEKAVPVIEVTSSDETLGGVFETLFGINPATGERNEPTMEQKAVLLRSEIERVMITKGVRGRASQSARSFMDRIAIEWREDRSGLPKMSGRVVSTVGETVARDLTDETVGGHTMTPSEGEHP